MHGNWQFVCTYIQIATATKTYYLTAGGGDDLDMWIRGEIHGWCTVYTVHLGCTQSMYSVHCGTVSESTGNASTKLGILYW